MNQRPTIEFVKDVTQTAQVMRNPSVSFLAEGHGNYNFLLQEDDRKLIFRFNKNAEPQFVNSRITEHTILRYFHAVGITCCPNAIYLDDTHPVLIESYLEGKEVTLDQLTNTQLQQYITTLHQVFSLKPNDLKRFCEQEGFPDLPPAGSIPEAVTIYGHNRLQVAKTGAWQVEPTILNWLQERLDKNMKIAKSLQQPNLVGVSLGDLQSHVIVSSTGDVQFFDFDHACYSHSIGLGSLDTLNTLSPEQFAFVVHCYAELTQTPVHKLQQQITMEKQLTLINDVTWAAMQWAQTGKEQYKTLTYQRKRIAEAFLASKGE
jgi:hypothetical protein